MIQKFNYFNEHEDYNIRLCNPNKNTICFLNFGYNKNLSLKFNEMSQFEMTIPSSYNGIDFEFYESVVSKKLILIEGIGYFIISDVQEYDDGIKKYKTITSYSLETELAYKKINLFDGTYKFYDPLNPKNTLLYNVLLTSNWTVGHIDSDLLNLYRTFEIPDSTVYEFLMNDVENSYECVFVFDSLERTVNAYTLENLAKNTDIVLSYNNLIKDISITEKSDEIVTCLSVYGGNDLGIAAVNPLGTNSIYNFDYFANTDWMEQDLITAINNWKNKVQQNQSQYSSLLTTYKNLNDQLVTQKSDLADLQAEKDSVEGVMKAMIEGNQSNTPQYTEQVNKFNSLQSQINSKNSEISNTQSQIDSTNQSLKNINTALSFSNNFTESQYQELKSYIIENTYQNESFITTSQMTNSEVQDVAMELYKQGSLVLQRVSQPRFSFELNAVNFVFLPEFQEFTKQLELGCIINIFKDNGQVLKPILLEMDIQLDDPTNFSMIFGNRFRLDSDEYTFRDLFGDAISAGSSVKFDGAKWGEYVNSGMNNTVSDFINSALDCAKNNVINATNQEIVINQNGLRGKRLDEDTSDYSPEQVWLTSNTLAFTKDNWQTVSLAVGKVTVGGLDLYGVVGDAIVGKIIAGNQLQISNDNNNFVLDSNGAVLNNASFTVVAQNNLSQIKINPTNGIQIQTRNSTTASWANSFYVDTSGNLTINGKITASSGTIGGWQIGTDRLYNSANGDYIGSNGNGKLSLLSWTPSSATFNGRIYASNLGDQIKTNNIADGSVTAAKLDTVYATKVFVDQMNAELATVHTLAANAATIEQLNATNANIANLNAIKLTTSSITQQGGVLGIFCSTISVTNSVDAGSIYTNLLDIQTSAFTLNGRAASWQTRTIGGTTITYLGR